MRRSDRRNGDLKAALLAEARRVLAEEGYAELSMRRIASAVGVTPTSIYLHFESKDALLHALIDEGMQALQRELRAAAEAAGDPIDRLRRVCRAYLDFGLSRPEWYEAMFLLHPRRMERYPPNKYRRARRNLEIFAEALRAARGQADDDADGGAEARRAATVAWSTLHGAIALAIAQRLDAGLDREAYLDAVVDRAAFLEPQDSPRRAAGGARKQT